MAEERRAASVVGAIAAGPGRTPADSREISRPSCGRASTSLARLLHGGLSAPAHRLLIMGSDKGSKHSTA